jgi:hypothetical protein
VRRHRAARPAPRRPEIDDDGDLASVDLSIEIRRSEFDRMAIEEALLAVSAKRTVADARFGQPVNGIAERAGEANGRIHGSGFSEDDASYMAAAPAFLKPRRARSRALSPKPAVCSQDKQLLRSALVKTNCFARG